MKRGAIMFAKHTVLCIAGIVIWIASLLVVMITLDSLYNIGASGKITTILFYSWLFSSHLVLIVVYYKRKYHLFALPLGHFLFPVFFLALWTLIEIFLPGRMPSNELFYTIMLLISYFIPTTLITLIISVVMEKKIKT